MARLVLTEANLDAFPPNAAGSADIASFTEEEFLDGGHARVLDRVGPLWAATMRLADPRALYRSAVALRRGSEPVVREILAGLDTVDRVYVHDGLSGALDGADALEKAGVRVVTVPGAGHNVVFDDADAFVRAVTATA